MPEFYRQGITQLEVRWQKALDNNASGWQENPAKSTRHNCEKSCLLIDIAGLGDKSTHLKTFEKRNKYKDLEIEISRKWHLGKKPYCLCLCSGIFWSVWNIESKEANKSVDQNHDNIQDVEIAKKHTHDYFSDSVCISLHAMKTITFFFLIRSPIIPLRATESEKPLKELETHILSKKKGIKLFFV